MTWQPIETAPKDGRTVLLWLSRGAPTVSGQGFVRAYWSETVESDHDDTVWHEGDGAYYAPPGWFEHAIFSDEAFPITGTPTHWMTIPEGPK